MSTKRCWPTMALCVTAILCVTLLAFAPSSHATKISSAKSLPSSTMSYKDALGDRRLRVIPGTGIFGDGESTFLFHGVNLVAKGHEALHLTKEMISFLVARGFNAVRVGFLWHDVEPFPGQFNTTYLELLRRDIDLLWEHGIRAILDMHQDCYSSYFCAQYDSLPDFITHPPNATAFYAGGPEAFPRPILEPKYDAAGEPTPENPWGRISNCQELRHAQLGWSSCYVTHAMGKSTQRLYDNADGIQDHFAEFWAYVVRFFKGHPGIVGYELINEPWLGDVPLKVKDFIPAVNPRHYDLWTQGVSDRKNLQAMYDRVQAAIRAVDPEAVIFFEPATGGNFLDALPVGFKAGPGGHEYDIAGQNVLSYHVYCSLTQKDVPGANATDSKVLNWIRDHTTKVCDLINGGQYHTRKQDIERLSVGGWLTEFGALVQDHRAYDILDVALSTMDKYLQSWTFWTDASLHDVGIEALVRPFPTMTWGTPTSLHYDNSTQVMTYTFKTPWRFTHSNTTAIFLPPPQARLAKNWAVEVRPFDIFNGYLDETSHMFLLQPKDLASTLDSDVTVTVMPAAVPPMDLY